MPFKFADHTEVQDIEDVDSNLRPFYHKPEGSDSYVVRADLQASADAWDGMATASQKIRKDNKALQSSRVDLSAFGEYGTTPEEILSSFTTQKQELSDAIEAKKGAVNPEKLRAQIMQGFEEKEKGWVAKNEALQGQLYNTLVTSEVTSAISKEKGDIDLLTPFVVGQIKMIESNGNLVARVMDSEGEVKYGSMGTEMTVAELVGNMKKDKKFSKLYESSAKEGGGVPPGRLPSNGPTNQTKRSAADKIQGAIGSIGK